MAREYRTSQCCPEQDLTPAKPKELTKKEKAAALKAAKEAEANK